LAPARKKTLLFLLKLLFSSGALYVVFMKAGPHDVLGLMKSITPWSFVSAVALYLAAQFLSSVRWMFLLPTRMGLVRLFRLYMLGSFFGTFLPGLVSGDAVKAYYLYRETAKGAEALSSTFMDRYIGFAALMALGTLAYPLGFRYLRGSWIQWTLPALVVLFVLASFLFFRLRLGRRIGVLRDAYGIFPVYLKDSGLMAKTFLLSVAVQALGIFAVYILAGGLGRHLPLWSLFIFLPIVITLSALPVSVSGLGIREASMVLLLGAVGVSPAAATAISLAWMLSVITGSLAGLFEYFRGRDNPVPT
jgi:uncharacterized membrane protein YbhN (UPF0104 family)